MKIWGLDIKKGPENSPCAQREIRTPTPFLALPPQDSVSTSFTIWAGEKKSDSAGARTQDPLLKRQLLYQLSYRIILSNNYSRKGSTKVIPIRSMSNIFKRIFRIIFIPLIIMGFQNAIAAGDDPKEVLQQADQLFDSDKYTEAIDLYTDLFESGEYSERMLYRMAFMYEKWEEYPEAIFYLRKAAQEYGAKGTEEKVRQIMRSQGGLRVFSSDVWDSYFAFFRSYGFIFWTVLAISVALLSAHYLLPHLPQSKVRKGAVVFSWVLLFASGSFLVHRSIMPPARAVIIEQTSFYRSPSYAAEKTQAAFSQGEMVTIEDRDDIWVLVEAGGRQWWVPNMVVREL